MKNMHPSSNFDVPINWMLHVLDIYEYSVFWELSNGKTEFFKFAISQTEHSKEHIVGVSLGVECIKKTISG